MPTTLEDILTFVNDLGCAPVDQDEHAPNQTVCYYLPVLEARLKIFITLENHGRLVQIYAYPYSQNLEQITPGCWELLHSLLNDFNSKVRYGRWSVDHEGDSRVQFSQFIEDAPFTRRQLSRIHFLMADLMVHQAQLLQMQARIQRPLQKSLFAVSGAVLQAVLDHPDALADIIAAVSAKSDVAKLLHEMAGKPFHEDEADAIGSDQRPDALH